MIFPRSFCHPGLARVGLFLILGFYAALSLAADLTIKKGDSLEILLADNATPAEKYAAEELSTYLGRVLSQPIPIKSAFQPSGGAFPIVVGWHPLNADLHPEKLKEEESVVDIGSSAIRIVGGRSTVADTHNIPLHDRGSLYGVYDFLETIGIRWYRPEPWGEHVPKLDEIKLQQGRDQSEPVFKYRYGISHYNTWGAPPEWIDRHFMAKRWAIRNRQNTNLWRERNKPGIDPATFGGAYEVDFAHAYFLLVPHEKYFKEHPEYFALIKGKRSSSPGAQLCLGNPKVQDLVFEKILKQARERPNQEIFSLDPNDTDLWCECELCTAMDNPEKKAPYGSGAGGVSMSDRVMAFNNIIARRLAEVMPGKAVGSYAYWQYTDPPSEDLQIEQNVIVQPAAFASTYSDYSRKLDDPASKQNRSFLAVLEGYRNRTRLFAREYWSYYIWPGPLPIIHTMVDRLQNYHSRFKVEGVYSETHPCWGPQGMVLYFYTWLLRNPYGDLEKEKELYYANFYGPAAGPMRGYHEKLEKIAQDGPYFGSGGNRADALFTSSLISELDAFLSEAQKLTNGQAPYEQRLAGVAAGQSFAKMAAQFHALVKNKEQEKAAKTLKAMEAFYYSFPDGCVFDVAPNAQSAYGAWAFRDYRKQITEHARMDALFENPKVIQTHNVAWRFNTDPENKGRSMGWAQEKFDDAQWGKIDAGKSWQNQGFADYRGSAWYRKNFKRPVIEDGGRIILYFEAVDGNAEIFLNGKSICSRHVDLNSESRKAPIYIDITDAISSVQINQLAVAVENTGNAGGLIRPVYILAVSSIRPPT